MTWNTTVSDCEGKKQFSEIKKRGLHLSQVQRGNWLWISVRLLEEGWHVVVTDLPGKPLESLELTLRERFAERVMAVALDVTSPESVEAGFEAVKRSGDRSGCHKCLLLRMSHRLQTWIPQHFRSLKR